MRVASSHTSRSLNGSILQLPATRAREWRTGPTSSTKGHHGRDDSTRTKHCRSESNSTTTRPLPKEKLSRAADLRVRIEQRNTPKTRTRAYVAGNYRNSQVRWTRRGHWCLTLKTPNSVQETSRRAAPQRGSAMLLGRNHHDWTVEAGVQVTAAPSARASSAATRRVLPLRPLTVRADMGLCMESRNCCTMRESKRCFGKNRITMQDAQTEEASTRLQLQSWEFAAL
jgi:hypothetical protein